MELATAGVELQGTTVLSRVGESKVLRHGERACPLGCTSARSRLGPSTTFIERQCMEHEWTLAHPLHDVDDIVEMADSVFGKEADGILTRDRNVFRKNVTITATTQLFDKGREFLAVCRQTQEHKKVVIDGFVDYMCTEPKLLAYCWFDRGGYTTYAQ